MYKRLLVPLDGSGLAEVALIYAREFAVRLGLEVVLLHACAPHEQSLASLHQAYLERAAANVRQLSDEVPSHAGGGTVAEAVQVRSDFVEGYPADEILRYVEDNGIDLILMATHGHSGIRRWTMGSVAEKIVRASHVPVCLIRSGFPPENTHDRWPARTVVVPLDGSDLAESVLPHVEALVRQRGAEAGEVILIRVCEHPEITADYPEASLALTWEEHVERVESRSREECIQYLQEVAQRLSDAGLNVRSEALLGQAENEIVAYLNRNPRNLVAMATHGRSGLRKWAFGSVAERVLEGVTCPMLLVRPQ